MKARAAKIRALHDRLEVVLPDRCHVKVFDDLVRLNGDWIVRQHLALVTRKKGAGEMCYFRGEQYAFEKGEGSVEWNESTRTVRAPGITDIHDDLVGRAKIELSSAIDQWAATMDAQPARITVRDQRTRWGSCSTRRNVNLNWRLIMSPPSALEYVVIHELAHLRHPNHSDAFWNEVATYCPDYRLAERWLHDHNTRLMLSFPKST